jgi:hypothetical protein
MTRGASAVVVPTGIHCTLLPFRHRSVSREKRFPLKAGVALQKLNRQDGAGSAAKTVAPREFFGKNSSVGLQIR